MFVLKRSARLKKQNLFQAERGYYLEEFLKII